MKRLVAVLALAACATPAPILRNEEPAAGQDPIVDMSGFSYFWRCDLRRSGAISCQSLFDLVPPAEVVELAGSCLRTSHGTVECTNSVDPFREIVEARGATRIASAYGESCAIRRDGGIACWATGGAASTYNVPRIRGAIDIAIDGRACAVLLDGRVWCWHHRDLPAPVPGISSAVAIALAAGTTCVRQHDGRVACWGDNAYGQLGDGSTERRVQPRLVPGLDHVRQIVMYAQSVCALRDDGSVWCWGGRAFSQHAERPRPRLCLRPTQVAVLGYADRIWMTLDTLCALGPEGRRICLSDSSSEAALYGVESSRHWLDGCR